MAYFNQAFNDFFKVLAANNNKEWFDENRKTYEKEVKAPFYQFVSDLIEEMNKIQPLDLEVKNAVFRINNDIRFNKEKPLYKMHVGAAVVNGGRKNFRDPGLYIQLSPGESFIASGVYLPEKDDLYKVRKAIAENLKEFQKLKNSKSFKSDIGGFGASKVNKIIPKEFKAAAEKEPILFNKQFYYVKEFADGEQLVLQDDLLKQVMKYYKMMQPMNDFFRKALD